MKPPEEDRAGQINDTIQIRLESPRKRTPPNVMLGERLIDESGGYAALRSRETRGSMVTRSSACGILRAKAVRGRLRRSGLWACLQFQAELASSTPQFTVAERTLFGEPGKSSKRSAPSAKNCCPW